MSFDGLSDRWRGWRERLPLDAYEARFAQMAADGQNIHGEVDAIERLRSDHPWTTPTILDAGCGTGRIAVELEARKWRVTGIDSDPDMIALARPKSETVVWAVDDLATFDFEKQFDVVLMAGNILLFVHRGTELAVLTNTAKHLHPDGLMVAGFSLTEFTKAQYDAWCRTAGLVAVDEWATWEGAAYAGGDYLVSVLRPLVA